MSFRVDLWNGFEIIKNKFTTTHKRIKNFNRLLNSYVNAETMHCRNLDTLFKECKEYDDNIINNINHNKENNIDYPLEQSLSQIINMIDYESTMRKEFVTYINKNIITKISKYLAEPKISLDQRFLESEELTQSFNKSVEKLASKQDAFYSQCKEISSFISQLVLDKNSDKKIDNKQIKLINRLIKSRDEYLFYLNETNIERKKYNLKIEKLLNELEITYMTTIQRFKEYLFDFGLKYHKILEVIFSKQKEDFEKYLSNIDLDKEKFLFIKNNVTKEFPPIKFEFCAFKEKNLKKFLKSKYHDKKIDKEYNEMVKEIQQLFKEKELFPDSFIQTGISKITMKKDFDFFSVRRFTKTKNNVSDPLERKLNTLNDKIKDKTPTEREEIIFENIKFIKDFINEAFTNGKAKLFEDKILRKEKLCKLEDIKGRKLSEDTNVNAAEILNLISKDNENSYLYIETIIKVLSFLRSKGFYEISFYNYKTFNAIFFTILDNNQNDDYIIKNIIILSQTFYYLDSDKRKRYLQDDLKQSDVFKIPEVWHRCINYTLNLSITDKDLTVLPNREDINKKIEKEANSVVTHYLCNFCLFNNDTYNFERLKDFYLGIYNLDEKQVLSSIEEYLKFYNKEYLKNSNIEIKKEEKEEQEGNLIIKVTKIEETKENKNEINDKQMKEEIKENKNVINDKQTKEEMKENTNEINEIRIKEEEKEKNNEKDKIKERKDERDKEKVEGNKKEDKEEKKDGKDKKKTVKKEKKRKSMVGLNKKEDKKEIKSNDNLNNINSNNKNEINSKKKE